MRHILSLLVENEAGALSRISGLFSARAYNIESLTVAPTEDETVSRMTIVTVGSDEIVEQITKQVNKLIDVIKVADLSGRRHISRELLLIKVHANIESGEKLKDLIERFHASIVDDSEATLTVELSDESNKIDEFIEAVEKELIIEVVRSGVTGIAVGSKAI